MVTIFEIIMIKMCPVPRCTQIRLEAGQKVVTFRAFHHGDFKHFFTKSDHCYPVIAMIYGGMRHSLLKKIPSSNGKVRNKCLKLDYEVIWKYFMMCPSDSLHYHNLKSFHRFHQEKTRFHFQLLKK
jgi:hypothetical protein